MFVNENTKAQIIIIVIGVLIGGGMALTNSLILYNTSLNKDKGDIAEGLYLDVSSFGNDLNNTDQVFLANPGGKYIFVQATALYPDNGLYFTYQRDIPKMDRKIAKDTFSFYNHLLLAEQDRSLIFEIQRLGDERDLTTAEITRQQILTEDAAREVNISVSILPTLKQELDAAT
jgi:hypothetical protein